MTRDEFIDGYMARSHIAKECRTADGFERNGYRRVALPCSCGDRHCDGWAMISPEYVDDHIRQYPPTMRE